MRPSSSRLSARLPLLAVLASGATSAVAQDSSVVAYTGEPAALAANGVAMLRFEVASLGAIADLDVQFEGLAGCDGVGTGDAPAVLHSRIGDLTIRLTSPEGTEVLLIDRRGGARNNICTTRFADDPTLPAIGSLSSVEGQPMSGAFRPESPLAAFNGEPPNGVWTLRIDNTAALAGSARRVALMLTTAAITDIVVDRLDDPAPDGCTPGSCSLREAVSLANQDAGFDRIVLPAGSLQLTRTGSPENANASGDLDVLEPLEIVGQGAAATVVEQLADERVMQAGPALVLRRLRLQGGDERGNGGAVVGRLLLAEDMTFADNRSASNGGAVHASTTTATLPTTLRRVRFENNQASNIVDFEARGGAVQMVGVNAPQTLVDALIVDDCDFVANRADDGGGAIAMDNLGGSTTLRILDSRFSANEVTREGRGGALASNTPSFATTTVEITDSRFENNLAPLGTGDNGGGALAFGAGVVTLQRVVLSANSARVGGAVHGTGGSTALPLRVLDSTLCGNSAQTIGGAIASSGSLDVRNSTLCGNSVTAAVGSIIPNGGGAISFDGAAMQVLRSTFDNNRAAVGATIDLLGGDLVMRNNTLTVPTVGTGASDGSLLRYANADTGDAFALHNNLLIGRCRYTATGMEPDVGFNNIEAGGDTCRLDAAQDNQVNANATAIALASLADNGGPTRTRLPSASSLAVDDGYDVACTSFDQRGYPVTDGACDIGAVEVGAAPATSDLFADGFEGP